MSITVQVKGATADRFRAYAAATGLRSPTPEQLVKAAAKGITFEPGQKVSYPVEDVAIEGPVTGSALSISSETVITRVAFYAGPVEEEVCVGSADVNAAGAIVFDLVEPAEPEQPKPIDISEL